MAERTYDLAAFVLPARSGDVAEQLLAGGDGGALVTGVLKLAQRFVVVLLTRRGSLPLLPERGTTLLDELASGRATTTQDVHAAFASAVGEAARQLRALERADDPDDERFADATLDRVGWDGAGPQLWVTLRSLAGAARQLVLPVSL